MNWAERILSNTAFQTNVEKQCITENARVGDNVTEQVKMQQ